MKSRMMMFTLNDCEVGQVMGFMLDHRKCCAGDFDSAFDFIFHPASEGMLKTIVCCWCGEGYNLVNMEFTEDDDIDSDSR